MLLDRLMRDLDVSVGPFAMCEVATGSRLLIGELGWVTLHFVLAGSGRINVGRSSGPEVSKYTLALVKRRHVLEGSSGDGTPAEDLYMQGSKILVGSPSGDADFVVACGRIDAEYGGSLSIFDLITDPIIVNFSDSPVMRQLFGIILMESGNPTEGSLGMIEASMRQCLVLLLRRLGETPDNRIAVLDGLGDVRMATVITDVLDHPEDQHTVRSMASTAMMSRSAFSDRFKMCFNDTPISFVRRVRLRRAAGLLRTTTESIGSVARATGFSSRSYFSQSFSIEYGATPGEFRKAYLKDSLQRRGLAESEENASQ